jgi:hypothetical protein
MIGNLDAVKSHLTGVKMMVTLRGGLHNLGLNGILEQMVLRYTVYQIPC